jgi:hypothetical protein
MAIALGDHHSDSTTPAAAPHHVPLPGKPPSDRALLKELGICPEYADYMCEVANSLSDEDIRPVVEWKSRREGAVRRQRAELRAFLRSRS